MANTPQDVLSALVRDAAEQQSALGKMPTPDENARTFAPILESLDRKNAEKAPGYSTTQCTTNEAQEIADEYVRKTGREAGEIRKVVGGPDQTPLLSPAVAERYAKIGRRLNLLTLSPKYSARAKAAIVFLADRNKCGMGDARMGRQIVRLLMDSRREFGPVMQQPKAPTLYSIGSKP